MKSNNKTFKDKIKYLTHPILTSIIKDVQEKNDNIYNYKALVFAGDMSPKYTYRNIIDFVSILNEITFKILIVGKNNKWIYELFKKNSVDRGNIEYIEWIENYNNICNPIYHVHYIPIVAGAGTKNRTLTACAKGVSVITTKIGFENISYGKPVNKIYIFKNIYSLREILNLIELPVSKLETEAYVKNINNSFQNELLEIINEDGR